VSESVANGFDGDTALSEYVAKICDVDNALCQKM
jgi:hypothetical protein